MIIQKDDTILGIHPDLAEKILKGECGKEEAPMMWDGIQIQKPEKEE